MAGTVTFGGIGSGIDVESLITGLVNASKGTLTKLKTDASDSRNAVSALSSVGSRLSSLSSALSSLQLTRDVAAYSATTSGTGVVATANGNAQPGQYSIQVNKLAHEQRTYSATFGTDSGALNQTGTFSIQVGSGTAANISVTASDSLNTIAAKINGAGIRASASVFYDGTAYRLQVRGLDSGTANALTFTETGTTLDLNGTGATANAGKTVQTAQDAEVLIDNFKVTRPTNQISGALTGVTLAVTQEGASSTLTVASDTSSLTTKINAVVASYNTVISTIHSTSGWGTTQASNSLLAGDSALRTISQKLAGVFGTITGSGKYANLASLGITQTRDGTLAFDSAKLTQAFADDPATVTNMLGRAVGATSGGAFATLRDAVTAITTPSTGLLASRQNAFTAKAKLLDDRATAEQTRLDNYAEQLRKSFTQMDSTVAANHALQTQVANLGIFKASG